MTSGIVTQSTPRHQLLESRTKGKSGWDEPRIPTPPLEQLAVKARQCSARVRENWADSMSPQSLRIAWSRTRARPTTVQQYVKNLRRRGVRRAEKGGREKGKRTGRGLRDRLSSGREYTSSSPLGKKRLAIVRKTTGRGRADAPHFALVRQRASDEVGPRSHASMKGS